MCAGCARRACASAGIRRLPSDSFANRSISSRSPPPDRGAPVSRRRPTARSCRPGRHPPEVARHTHAAQHPMRVEILRIAPDPGVEVLGGARIHDAVDKSEPRARCAVRCRRIAVPRLRPHRHRVAERAAHMGGGVTRSRCGLCTHLHGDVAAGHDVGGVRCERGQLRCGCRTLRPELPRVHRGEPDRHRDLSCVVHRRRQRGTRRAHPLEESGRTHARRREHFDHRVSLRHGRRGDARSAVRREDILLLIR